MGRILLLANSRQKNSQENNILLQDISRNRFNGLGKPEPLKGELSGIWSRRIDDANRLLYKISDDCIEIIQCKGHYDD